MRKDGLVGIVMGVMLISALGGCNMEPVETESDDMAPGRGLFSGKDGKFVILCNSSGEMNDKESGKKDK